MLPGFYFSEGLGASRVGFEPESEDDGNLPYRTPWPIAICVEPPLRPWTTFPLGVSLKPSRRT
jgi:hypothetical protein